MYCYLLPSKAGELARIALEEHGIGKSFVAKDSSAAAIDAATAEIAAMKAKADQEIAEMKEKAEKERLQQAPTKATVRIDGVTGPNAGVINGMYEATSEMSGDMPEYMKVGDRFVWLEYIASRMLWQVTDSGSKGTSSAMAYCDVPAKCLPQDCPAGGLRVYNGYDYDQSLAFTFSSVTTQVEVDAYLAHVESEANRVVKGRHSIRIAGVTGQNEATVNGVYKPTAEMRDNVTLYVKVNDSNIWLEYHASYKQWQLVPTECKGDFGLWVYCSVPAKCLPQDCPVGKWQEKINKWDPQPAITISIA